MKVLEGFPRRPWLGTTTFVVLICLVIVGCGTAPGSVPASAAASPAAASPAAASPAAASPAPGTSASAAAGDVIGAAETTKVSLGIRTGNIGSVAPLFIAKENGYYADEGLEVEIIITDQVQEGMVGGSLDVGIFDPDATVESINQGVPLIMVAGNRQREPLIIGTAKGITEVGQLAGKDVALGLGPGDPATAFRLDALKEAGWDLSTVDVQYVSPPGGSDARAELLHAGQIALTYLFPRHKQPTTDAGGILIVDDYLDPFLNDAFISTKDWAAANPNTLARFLKATIRGKQIFADLSQKDAVLDIMAKAGFEVGESERAFYEFDPPQHDIDMAIPEEGYDRLMEASGVEDPGFGEVTSFDSLHLAQKALGLPER
jgi:NitT/TauT family transport system substrate-binding protein